MANAKKVNLLNDIELLSIPKPLLKFKGISSTAKLCWALMYYMCDEKNKVGVSQRLLAHHLGLSISQTRRILTELESYELITSKQLIGINIPSNRSKTYTLQENKILTEGIGEEHGDSRIGTTLKSYSSYSYIRISKDILNTLTLNNMMTPSESCESPGDKVLKLRTTPLRRKPAKKQPSILVPSTIQAYIDIWEDAGLTVHRRNTKVFRDAVSNLKKLKLGTLYNGSSDFQQHKDQPFTLEDFTLSVDRYHTALTDPLVFMQNKTNIKVSLPQFLLNPYGKGNASISYFLYFVFNEPKILNEHSDPHPKLTNAIIAEYKKTILGGLSKSVSALDKHKFQDAATKFKAFMKNNQSKVSQLHMQTEDDMARTLILSVMKSLPEDAIVYPGTIASETTFSRRLPSFLQAQGLVIETGKKSLVNLGRRLQDQ